ncbi:MAG TPA: DUF1003 domain-containing protein [Ferrovibrio sp.]|uniref:DUF1003 domain-containing protein n=1 Tax=Ferrovibrio sp. TaxID=1917215 RepID=UPI002ED04DBF
MPAAPYLISDRDRTLLHELRQHSRRRRDSHRAQPPLPPRGATTFGQRIADAVTGAVGSWGFILTQTALLGAWLIGNALVGREAWDPYPFILLNLLLSFQAAYTAPIIMMSQNRAAEMDRARAESDYRINIKAELEIELLHQKIDLLREQELLALTNTVRALIARLDGEKGPGGPQETPA